MRNRARTIVLTNSLVSTLLNRKRTLAQSICDAAVQTFAGVNRQYEIALDSAYKLFFQTIDAGNFFWQKIEIQRAEFYKDYYNALIDFIKSNNLNVHILFKDKKS